LSSASEYLHQESVEPLATKKALLDESVSGKENGETDKNLFDNLATNTGCFDQMSANKPTHHRKMVEAVISVSQEVSHHDCCIEQVILNKSDFAYPATDVQNYKTEKVFRVKGDPNFPWSGSASMTQNDERRRRVKRTSGSSSVLTVNVDLIASPEIKIRVDEAELDPLLHPLGSNLNAGITTKDVARELRQSFRGIILTIRSRLSSEKGIICRNSTKALGAALMQCVEQFVHIVDDRVMRYKWLEAWDRGCLLRLKADFIRYLYEAFPANLTYQLKCQEAYKCARLFFLENGLQDKAEWVYLQMNYATFLYMLGNRSTALFINERLINSLIVRRCGKAIKAKLQLNLQFYSKPW
uniref:Trafficking protein particle complex subunit 11 n=1 Tax=Hydatigena taeniaeformis TaxID=6205 RepID=A0A0R3XA42_HYDTA